LETSYLVTFGGDADGSFGDDDRVQLLFVDMPDSLTDTLHLRIFDADTGGDNFGDTIIGETDTTITYTLYGLTGTYTVSEAREAHPSKVGITSGTALVTDVISQSSILSPSATLDGEWYRLYSFVPSEGEQIGSQEERYVFKLAVEGAKGDDGNRYNVAVSTSPNMNTVPSSVRLFAFSWTWLVFDRGGERYRPNLYIYVGGDTAIVRPHFFPDDLPFTDGCACVQICTPLRCVPATDAQYEVEPGEWGATWTVDMSDCELRDPSRRYTIGFWADGFADEDDPGGALPVFCRSTTDAPPP
jgi:hypothetical protein